MFGVRMIQIMSLIVNNKCLDIWLVRVPNPIHSAKHAMMMMMKNNEMRGTGRGGGMR